MARKSMAGTGSNSAEHHDDGLLRRASSALGRVFGRRQKSASSDEPVRTASSGSRTRNTTTPGESRARTTKRPSDIELDVLNRTYTPAGTSGKAGFRSDGSDHQRDQEFATGVSDERWNDEDRYTNKSGDPRIGTRGRTYEPGEARNDSRDR